MKTRIKWVILFRLIVISILFVSTIIVSYFEQPGGIYWFHLYFLIFITYIVTLLFTLILKYSKRTTLLAWAQIPLDIFIITDLVILTDGIDSVFSFLYFLAIIISGYTLFSKGSFVAAALSSAIFSISMISLHGGFLERWRGIFNLRLYLTGELIHHVSFYAFSFFLAAFLISYLTEQLRRAGIDLLKRERDIRNLEAIHNRVVQNIKSGVLTIDRGRSILTFNRAAERLTGYRFEEVAGRSVEEFFPGISGYLQPIEIDEGTMMLPDRWEKYYTTKSGEKVYIRFSLSPMEGEGGTRLGDIILLDDLTEQITMAEEMKRKEKMAAVGRLASAIAHEIRNPLASISGSIEVLKGSLNLSGENESLMNIILRETDRLNSLMADFLTLTKQSRKKVVEIDLRNLIGEIITTFMKEEEVKKRYRVIAEYRDTEKVMGDPDMLKQVMWNLLMNAAESMPDGGDISISMDDDTTATDGRKGVKLDITDNGSGMSEEVIGHIFEPFFTTKSGGTGLGLSIVYNIIEAHGGKIRVESEVDRGTKFEIILPAQE